MGRGCRKSRQGSNPKAGRKAGAGRGLGGGGGVHVRRGQDGEKREGLGSLERVALWNGEWEEMAGDQSKRPQSQSRGTGCELLDCCERKRR